MARTLAPRPPGARITDYSSLGVVAPWFPRGRVDQVLAKSGQTSRRQRHLPAPVVVYYVVAPALDRPVCYREGRLYSRPALPRQRGSATHWLARRYSKP